VSIRHRVDSFRPQPQPASATFANRSRSSRCVPSRHAPTTIASSALGVACPRTPAWPAARARACWVGSDPAQPTPRCRSGMPTDRPPGGFPGRSLGDLCGPPTRPSHAGNSSGIRRSSAPRLDAVRRGVPGSVVVDWFRLARCAARVVSDQRSWRRPAATSNQRRVGRSTRITDVAHGSTWSAVSARHRHDRCRTLPSLPRRPLIHSCPATGPENDRTRRSHYGKQRVQKEINQLIRDHGSSSARHRGPSCPWATTDNGNAAIGEAGPNQLGG
jgi:hypothetical protein